jgi:hypothetical protein
MPQSLSGKSSRLRPLASCEWCGEPIKIGTANLAQQLGPEPNLYGALERIVTSLCDGCFSGWRAMLSSREIER